LALPARFLRKERTMPKFTILSRVDANGDEIETYSRGKG
jgi:hypothetical protein